MQIIYIAAFSITLSGCVSMLNHFRFSDSDVTSQARNMAFVMTCVENGMTDGALGYSFAHAMTNLHSVAVVDKSLYEKTYRNLREHLASSSSNAYAADCSRINKEVPTMLPIMRARYEETMQRRRMDAVGMSQTLSQTGVNNSFNPVYMPVSIPSGQVTFGSRQTGPRMHHFLVDIGQGQRQCSVSESGYVLCR